MTSLPTPDRRRRTLLLLEHIERTLMAVLAVRPCAETRAGLRRVRKRIEEIMEQPKMTADVSICAGVLDNTTRRCMSALMRRADTTTVSPDVLIRLLEVYRAFAEGRLVERIAEVER